VVAGNVAERTPGNGFGASGLIPVALEFGSLLYQENSKGIQMFDQEIVKQSAELGSNAIVAKVPGPRIAPHFLDNEHAGTCDEISAEAIRAHTRTNDVHGLRCHVAYRDGVGRMSLVVAATWVPTCREFDHDDFQAAASTNAVRRWPW
jgi:hypothetical protein